jgi:hypothetical protein
VRRRPRCVSRAAFTRDRRDALDVDLADRAAVLLDRAPYAGDGLALGERAAREEAEVLEGVRVGADREDRELTHAGERIEAADLADARQALVFVADQAPPERRLAPCPCLRFRRRCGGTAATAQARSGGGPFGCRSRLALRVGVSSARRLHLLGCGLRKRRSILRGEQACHAASCAGSKHVTQRMPRAPKRVPDDRTDVRRIRALALACGGSDSDAGCGGRLESGTFSARAPPTPDGRSADAHARGRIRAPPSQRPAARCVR